MAEDEPKDLKDQAREKMKAEIEKEDAEIRAREVATDSTLDVSVSSTSSVSSASSASSKAKPEPYAFTIIDRIRDTLDHTLTKSRIDQYRKGRPIIIWDMSNLSFETVRIKNEYIPETRRQIAEEYIIAFINKNQGLIFDCYYNIYIANTSTKMIEIESSTDAYTYIRTSNVSWLEYDDFGILYLYNKFKNMGLTVMIASLDKYQPKHGSSLPEFLARHSINTEKLVKIDLGSYSNYYNSMRGQQLLLSSEPSLLAIFDDIIYVNIVSQLYQCRGMQPPAMGMQSLDMGMPPQGMRMPPQSMRMPPTDMRWPPQDMRMPPQGMRMSFQGMGRPPTDMGWPPTDMRMPPQDMRMPPYPLHMTPTARAATAPPSSTLRPSAKPYTPPNKSPSTQAAEVRATEAARAEELAADALAAKAHLEYLGAKGLMKENKHKYLKYDQNSEGNYDPKLDISSLKKYLKYKNKYLKLKEKYNYLF